VSEWVCVAVLVAYSLPLETCLCLFKLKFKINFLFILRLNSLIIFFYILFCFIVADFSSLKHKKKPEHKSKAEWRKKRTQQPGKFIIFHRRAQERARHFYGLCVCVCVCLMFAQRSHGSAGGLWCCCIPPSTTIVFSIDQTDGFLIRRPILIISDVVLWWVTRRSQFRL
jgi:hypothetical protein